MLSQRMRQSLDLRQLLDSWAYDPEENVRLVRGQNGREFVVVRQRLGLEHYEVDGRPDGRRPHGMESALDFQLARLAEAKRSDTKYAFRLTAKECTELFDEATIYYHRFLHFLRLKEWVRAERDTERSLGLLDFVQHYGEHEEDRQQLEPWHHDTQSMNAVARAMLLLEKGQSHEALRIARESIAGIEGNGEHLKDSRELANALLLKIRKAVEFPPSFRPREESVFARQGDYWTIIYHGQTARLKATRGLHWLASLLRHPGREFHVNELAAEPAAVPLLAGSDLIRLREAGVEVATAHAQTTGPLLDVRAKTDYQHRFQDLREELEEATRFNDQGRAAKAQDEMNSIAVELASAMGLGGRDRKTGSDAERARSTVTKRIKDSIHKITEATPSLGRHLDARIKTGYFCSYNPHPDRPVAWRF